MSKEFVRNALSVTGLFIPYRADWMGDIRKKWVFTISVGNIPLGWLMIAVAVGVKYLLP